jgi:hypothetical protein
MHNDFQFIKRANLPENIVKHCVISENAEIAINFLNNIGIETLLVKTSDKLENEISAHTDLQFAYCNNKTAVISPNQASLHKKLNEIGCRVEVAEFEPFSPYPNDILMNCVFLNDCFIAKLDSTSKKILSIANNNSLKLINIKQGYSKCSICVVSENAIITEDNGIARLLNNSQIKVLKIKPDFIKLSDEHFGFLGGASGKISRNEIFFNGNIEEHPSYTEISDFLKTHNVKPIYDKSYKLTDIGSIIPITEQI